MLPTTLLLPVAASRSYGAPGTVSYSPSEPVMTQMTPFQSAASNPIVITAEELHASLLRDGLFVLGWILLTFWQHPASTRSSFIRA